MSGDQASGLRQWSKAHTGTEGTRQVPVALVVMTWHKNDASPEALARRLTLPKGVSRWQPRPLVLSAALPDPVPDSFWWVLDMARLEARSAPKLAEALRLLHYAGMPRAVLLTAPELPWVPGLISAVHTHLGVRLLQDERIWHQSVTAGLKLV